MYLFQIGPTGIIFVLIIAFLIYGPKRLPEMGKTLGQALKAFRGEMTNSYIEANRVEEKKHEEQHEKGVL